jgi:GNAT superfamily N-acetyltransferase
MNRLMPETPQTLSTPRRHDRAGGIIDIAIRPYADDDFDAVTSLWLRSWRSAGVPGRVTLEELRERWPDELADGWIVHVATADQTILGFLAYREDTLEQLFIAPASQGRGIGKQLLDFAKAQMPGGFRLHTAAQSRAGRFYEREGLLRGKTSTHRRHGHRIVHYSWTARNA